MATTQTTDQTTKKEKKERNRRPQTFRICYLMDDGSLKPVDLPEDFQPSSNSYDAIKRAVKSALNAGKGVKELAGKSLKIIVDNHPAFRFDAEVEERVIRNVVVKEVDLPADQTPDAPEGSE